MFPMESMFPQFLFGLTVMDQEAFQRLYNRKPSRSCCCQPLSELREHGHHEKFVHTIKGPIADAWGLGSVWVTCCGAYYGMFFDEQTDYYPLFLGHSEEQAMLKTVQVKSFFKDLTGR